MKVVVAALAVMMMTMAADSGCAPDEAPIDRSPETVAAQPTESDEDWWKRTVRQLGGDADNRTQISKISLGEHGLPAGWVPPAQPPRPGYRLYSVEVQSVDAANLPTVRRVGAKMVGIADDGSLVLVNGQPYFYDEQVSTPHVFDLEVAPGIVTINVMMAMVGRVGEGLIVTVDEYGTGPTGLMGGDRIVASFEGQQRGAVVVQFPIAIPPA